MNEQAMVAVGNSLAERARGLVISTPDDYERAAQMRTVIRERLKEAKAETEQMLQGAKAAYDAARALVKRITDPMNEADAVLKLSMDAYLTRRQREIDERKRIAEEAARQAEAAERERLMRKAEVEMDSGNDEYAEDLLSEAETVYIAPVPVVSIRHEAATQVRRDITVDVVSIIDLCKAIGARRLPVDLIAPQMGKLKAYCKAVGGEIPGVRVTETVSSVMRSK